MFRKNVITVCAPKGGGFDDAYRIVLTKLAKSDGRTDLLLGEDYNYVSVATRMRVDRVAKLFTKNLNCITNVIGNTILLTFD